MTRVSSFVLISCLLAAPASAQEPEPATRAELLAQIREQKAQNLQPAEPKGVEKALLYIEKHRLIERLTIADGWYPRIGGLTTGGGFAGGVGYRKHVMGERLFLNGSAAISTKGYKQVLAHVSNPTLLKGWLEVGGNFRWNDFPQEDFFGIGNDSAVSARTNYALESTDISAQAALKPFAWMRFGAEIGHFAPTISEGTDSRFPSTEEIFTDIQAPGLVEQPDFLYKNLFLEIDYRDQPGNPRSGGLWRASYAAWNDRELNQFDFGRLDAEAAHFFPIFDKKRVFAVRLGLSYVNNDPGNRVPFYFLPYIGGSNTVRGFKEFRFRDENAVFLNAEYRWEAFAGLDMALFFDMGEVRDDWQDIDFREAKTSYGVGFRFNTFKSVFMRLDIGAGGGEGTQIFFKFGPAF
jgi:outer membrane protein assembly factor BamA